MSLILFKLQRRFNLHFFSTCYLSYSYFSSFSIWAWYLDFSSPLQPCSKEKGRGWKDNTVIKCSAVCPLGVPSWGIMKPLKKEKPQTFFYQWLFIKEHSDRTGWELTVINWKIDRSRLQIKKKFFTIETMTPWNMLLRETGAVPSLKMSKDRAWSNLVQQKCPCPWQEVWNQTIFGLQHKPFCNSMITFS